MLAFREFQLGVIADRRAQPPQDDLVSILCDAEIDGERLDDESIIQESLLILIGGDETSRHVMTDGMLALLEPSRSARDPPRPNPRRSMRVSRSCCAGCRRSRTCRAPSPATSRCTGRRCTRATSSSSCIRRPTGTRACFEEPERFDVLRNPNPHLAFGFGPHFCMGASLARIELKVMFSELLRRLPDLHLAGEPLPRRPSNFISGPEAMPVAFTPA